MRLVHLESSMISSMGYNPETETMVVHFQNGKVYRYDGVPSGVYLSVITDDGSTGKSFNKHIRSKDFPYTEVKLADAQNL